jgi:hypothetical protein
MSLLPLWVGDSHKLRSGKSRNTRCFPFRSNRKAPAAVEVDLTCRVVRLHQRLLACEVLWNQHEDDVVRGSFRSDVRARQHRLERQADQPRLRHLGQAGVGVCVATVQDDARLPRPATVFFTDLRTTPEARPPGGLLLSLGVPCPGLAWKIARRVWPAGPTRDGTLSIVACWQTGPTSTGSGTLYPKLLPPSTDRATPRQLQALSWPAYPE